jgi:threonine aldolase
MGIEAMLIRHLASDNASGVHPSVLRSLQEVNAGHCMAYGEDPVTLEAENVFREQFGKDSFVFFVQTGTAANVISLQSVTESYQAVICSDCSHLHRDECGAPEKFLGSKLLLVPSQNGKITPVGIEVHLQDAYMVHRSQPKVVSITQATELGTVYRPEEIREISEFCHNQGLFLHIDGARLVNAAVSLGLSLRESSRDLGVDLLSFGGTKNGLLAAEAIICFDSGLAARIPFYRKQAMQLGSKMRFVAAQFLTYFKDELWKKNAEHANRMAKELADQCRDIAGVEIIYTVETNAVFARIPKKSIGELQALCPFHVWNPQDSIVRLMTSFDTTSADIQEFTKTLRASTTA